uniref:Uncharacterized protein n=1 Tax=Cacopsylla melanoneura TaxID=428564 RepID=A0A8D8RUG1_9HEMI
MIERENLPVGSEYIYRSIFKYDFNISFHIPKKDQCEYCELCVRYKIITEDSASTPEDGEANEEDKRYLELYEKHLIEINLLARGEKDDLKEKLAESAMR